MSNQIAIVIPVYQRVHHLNDLLKSLEQAYYGDHPVPLVFKTHEGVSAEVWSLVNQYEWKYGPKDCIKDGTNIGLDANLMSCGDLTEQFESVIILEDDTIVSPHFYTYALAALKQQGSHPSLGQISLYRYHHHPITHIPHHILDDASDGFFLQKTSTRGQLFTQQQWSKFKVWLSSMPVPDFRLPQYIKNFGSNNWEYLHNWYLVQNNLFVLYPKLSVATNQGPAGTHHSTSIDSGYFQVPLRTQDKALIFKSFEHSDLCYDTFFEWLPEKLNLRLGALTLDQDFDVDLYGNKPLECLQRPLVFTSKDSKTPIQQFGDGLKPIELNLIAQSRGTHIHLSKRDALVKNSKSNTYQRARQYFGNVGDVGLWNFIRFKWLKYVERKR